MKNKTHTVHKKEQIKSRADRKVGEDINNYPGKPAKDEAISPASRQQKKTTRLQDTYGEKRIYKKDETDEQDSDGSANAFGDK